MTAPRPPDDAGRSRLSGAMGSATGTMTRVAACAGAGEISVDERSLPDPQPGEILIRVRACGFCGTDLHKIRHDTAPVGTVLGHELVGTVEATGPGVTSVRHGERVVVPHHVACRRCHLCRSGSETQCPTFLENLLSPGGFSELVIARARAVERALYQFDSTVPDEAALFVEPGGCVVRGIEHSALLSRHIDSEDKCAVVVGGGSMGLLHLLVLRALDPSMRVVVVDPIEERRDLARRLGAVSAVDPRNGGAKEIREMTEGRGADVAFDTVGGAEILTATLDLVRAGGTVVLFAHAREGEAASFTLNAMFKTEKRVIATYSGGLEDQRTAHRLIASGRLDPRPLVTHRVALDGIGEAIRLVESRKALKVLVVPGGTA